MRIVTGAIVVLALLSNFSCLTTTTITQIGSVTSTTLTTLLISTTSVTTSTIPGGCTDLMIYNGESFPYRAGSNWDSNGSTIASSTASPYSGSNHIRATITEYMWWGGVAYAFQNWGTQNWASHFRLEFYAKADSNTTMSVRLFDPSTQGPSVSVPLITTYTKQSILLSSLIYNSTVDLTQTRLILFLSQTGSNSSHVIDIDDIRLTCGLATTTMSTVTTAYTGTTTTYYSLSYTFSIDVTQPTAPISPYIYGVNWAGGFTDQGVNISALRLGGNRLTGYNWENNASNAGSDYYHSSDGYLSNSSTPGKVITDYHDTALANNAMSLITLQAAGYVSKDKNGVVDASETAPSARWDAVDFTKGSAFSLLPDSNDGMVYMDELVNFLVSTYGSASTATGVKAYSIDNEPALWKSTHPRIHPAAVGCDELIQRSTDLTNAVKTVDASAEMFGPALYGYAAYRNLQSAPDWPVYSGSYPWFIDFYLDKMKDAGTVAGKRLLDVLDVHWYPEAQGMNLNATNMRITLAGAGSTDPGVAEARKQAPRSLWDNTYTETSWIASTLGGPIYLLNRLQSSIATYYPGTKLAFTEYDYGGKDHVSGGIAVADVLGIYGKYGIYYATYFGDSGSYLRSAFKVYRNYDGSMSTIGDQFVSSSSSNAAKSSVYASIATGMPNQLHVIAINKDDMPSLVTVNATSGTSYVQSEVWGFDSQSSNITNRGLITGISGNSFQYILPANSVIHFVMKP